MNSNENKKSHLLRHDDHAIGAHLFQLVWHDLPSARNRTLPCKSERQGWF